MKCPSCGEINPPDDVYCECGYYLKGKLASPSKPKRCPNPNCNFENPPEAVYCDCGYHFKDILAPTKRCSNPDCDSLNPLDAISCECGYDFMKTLPEEELMKCPSCDSKQLTTNKQGYGWKKGLAVGVCTIGIGVLAGFINSNKVWVTCLKCGHRWKAGEA